MGRCMGSPITTCISTNNNLNYVKLAYKSVRRNAYYKDQPIVIHAENCSDGTDEWLVDLVKIDPNVKGFIEHNDNPRGIGGGMDFCVDKVDTEYVNIIQTYVSYHVKFENVSKISKNLVVVPHSNLC